MVSLSQQCMFTYVAQACYAAQPLTDRPPSDHCFGEDLNKEMVTAATSDCTSVSIFYTVLSEGSTDTVCPPLSHADTAQRLWVLSVSQFGCMYACAFETEFTETQAVASAVLWIDDIIFHVWANHKAVLGVWANQSLLPVLFCELMTSSFTSGPITKRCSECGPISLFCARLLSGTPRRSRVSLLGPLHVFLDHRRLFS